MHVMYYSKMGTRNCGDAQPKRPHFFKIILEDPIQTGKLSIPPKFVRKYGNDLQDTVFLKVPNGITWQMELKKCDGGTWLQKGWQEFAERYSLSQWHLLVFEYEGNCCFHVLIFDTSATEIEYPSGDANNEEPEQNERFHESESKETADDVSLEILGDLKSCQKTRDKPPVSYLCPHCFTDRNCGQSSGTKLNNPKRKAKSGDFEIDLEEGNSFACKEVTPMDRGSSESQFLGRKRCQTLTGDERIEALKRADAFESKNPFFKVTIQPSYTKYRKLSVPSQFAREHLKIPTAVSLCISDCRIWPAKYENRWVGAKKYARIYNGWSKFARDNCLKVGDTCVFELVNLNSFKVSISRCANNPDYHLSLDDSRANGSKPTRDNESGCTKSNRNGMCRLGITSSAKSFQVHKVEENDDAMGPEEGNSSNWKAATRVLPISPRSSETQFLGLNQSSYAKLKALQRADAFRTINPFYKIAIRPSYVGCRINLPSTFANMYFKQEQGDVRLCTSDGRVWPAKYWYKEDFGEISDGWGKFAHDNRLRIGDVCAFELLTQSELSLKVTIFRNVDDERCGLLLNGSGRNGNDSIRDKDLAYTRGNENGMSRQYTQSSSKPTSRSQN